MGRVADEIWKTLESCKGFDWWFDDIDPDIQREIRAAVDEAERRALAGEGGPADTVKLEVELVGVDWVTAPVGDEDVIVISGGTRRPPEVFRAKVIAAERVTQP